MKPRDLSARSSFALSLLLLVPTFAHAQSHAEDARTVRLELTHGAYVRPDAPEAIAHVPVGVTADRIALVLYLHGYSGCIEVLASSAPDARCRPRDHATRGWGLVRAHDRAGTRSVFLMPQLTFMQRRGAAGRFGRPGEAARFVEEALVGLAPLLGRVATLDDVASVTVIAHSAGFETALAILRHGGLDAHVRHVVLFDALYSGREGFLGWLADASPASPRTLVSFATGAATLENTRALFASASRRWPRSVIDAVDFASPFPAPTPRLVVQRRAHVPHAEVPITYLAETLRALGLPLR